jgi:hypothetical protein
VPFIVAGLFEQFRAAAFAATRDSRWWRDCQQGGFARCVGMEQFAID